MTPEQKQRWAESLSNYNANYQQNVQQQQQQTLQQQEIQLRQEQIKQMQMYNRYPGMNPAFQNRNRTVNTNCRTDSWGNTNCTSY